MSRLRWPLQLTLPACAGAVLSGEGGSDSGLGQRDARDAAWPVARILFDVARRSSSRNGRAAIHRRFRTPYEIVDRGGVCSRRCRFIDSHRRLAVIVNIGTLLAFVIVCAGVWILRRKRPDLAATVPDAARCRSFPSWGYHVVAAMASLPAKTWWRLLIWLGIGLLVYAFYGRVHSKVRNAPPFQ